MNRRIAFRQHGPNIISALRIAGSMGLLFCNVAGWPFWTLYVLCGISDMADGWLARKLNAESKTGAVLDSVADILVNQVSALVVCKRFCFPHTWANKLTGLFLFLAAPTMFWSVIPISMVAAIATFAAVQEGHFIRTKQLSLATAKKNSIR